MPGACDLAEWNVPHAPHEHRSLLVEIDEGLRKRVSGARTEIGPGLSATRKACEDKCLTG